MTSGKPIHSVLIVSASRQLYDCFKEILPGGQYAPIAHVTSASEAKRMLLSSGFDIIIVNTPLADEFGVDFATDLADGLAGVLLLVKNDSDEQISYQTEDSGVLTMAKPAHRQALYAAVKLLTAMNARLRKMEQKNKTLQEKMTDIRLINRAKWLLIENLGMSEKDAHYYIEKQAMDQRISRREIAGQIIFTYEK